MLNNRLKVNIGGVEMKNPIMPASGTFSEEYAQVIDFNSLGALVTKSVTPEPRMGNFGPRVAETPCGMINAVGIQSKGVEAFICQSIPFYKQFSSPLIVSISANTADRFAELASRLTLDGVAGLEVNISCPNLEDNGRSFAMDAQQTYQVIKRIRKATHLPLWAKLTPNASNIVEIAVAAEQAGADALVVANTILAMAIDVKNRKPKVGNIMGGLSGPAVKPIIVRMVYQVAKQVNIPVIGCGGITSVEDVLEYMIAGASAVQVGTYSFVNPYGMCEIIEGLQNYLYKHNLSSVNELVGSIILNEKQDLQKAKY